MLSLSRGWYWAAVVAGALFLLQYWLELLTLIAAGDPWGHKNYWGGDVGLPDDEL